MSVELKENSRDEFTAENNTYEVIQIGCMQRIADAVEILTADHTRLKKELAFWKELANDHRQRCDFLSKQVASYKGLYTRMKRERDALKK